VDKRILLAGGLLVLTLIAGGLSVVIPKTALQEEPQNIGLAILTAPQGGTGKGSATAGDVGKVLKVLDDSPFTYEFATDNSGSGGGSGSVGTSTVDVANQITFFTTNGATPALIAGDAGMTYNATTDLLTVVAATTTRFSAFNEAKFGATATSSFNSAGALTVSVVQNILNTAFSLITQNSNGNNGITVTAGNAVSGNTAGGAMTYTTGDGQGTQAGGNFTVNLGTGGATGSGGSFGFNSGSAGGGNGAGGEININTGDGSGSGNGGNLSFAGGAAGETGAGSALSFIASDGGATSVAGGSITFTSGAGVGTDSNGGNINLTAGTGTGVPGKIVASPLTIFDPAASSTRFSSFLAWFGQTATSTFDAGGNLSLIGNLTLDAETFDSLTDDATLANNSGDLQVVDVTCTNCLTVTEVASADLATLATNVSDTDFGDVTVASGAWAVEDDSHAHTATSISGLGTADISGLDISDDTNLAATYPVVLTGDTLSLAFGTTTNNTWAGLQTFTNASSTLFSTEYASSTLYYGAGLADCNTENMLTWTAGKFGCESDTSGSGSALEFVYGTNIFSEISAATTSNLEINGLGTSTFAGGIEAWRQISAPYFHATSSVSSVFTSAPTFSSLTSALVLTGSTGLTAEYTGIDCTNQFVRDVSAVGAGTCATVVGADVDLGDLTATDTTLTFSGTYDGQTARTIGLNLGNSNTWTVLQTFGFASTTRLTAFTEAKFGSTATSSFNSAGALTLASALTVPNGGTGVATLTDHGVLIGSGVDVFTALSVGTNGQLLVGSTGADPVFATLNCADNLTCTTGAGTLEIDVDDSFLLNTGDTGTGNYVLTNASTTRLSVFTEAKFGATATSTFDSTGSLTIDSAGFLVVPQGTAPVVTAAGKIALDTSDNQFLVGTSTDATPAVFSSSVRIWSATVASTSVDFASGGRIWLPVQRDGFYITEIHCAVDAGTSKVINVSNTAGNADTDAVTCDADGASDVAMSTNFTVTAGTLMSLEMGATTGTVDYVTFSVWGKWIRE